MKKTIKFIHRLKIIAQVELSRFTKVKGLGLHNTQTLWFN
jgi:hypothetical protein